MIAQAVTDTEASHDTDVPMSFFSVDRERSRSPTSTSSPEAADALAQRQRLAAGLPMDEAVVAMEAAFGDDREIPLRSGVGVSLFMPGRVGGITGVKVVSSVPGDPAGIVAVFGPDGRRSGWSTGRHAHRNPHRSSQRTGHGFWLRPGWCWPCSAPGDGRRSGGGGPGGAPDREGPGMESLGRAGGGAGGSDWRRGDRRRRWCGGRGRHRVLRDAGIEPFVDRSVAPGTHINAVGLHPDMVEIPPETDRTRLRGSGRR